MINHMIASYISCLALGWGLLFFDWALNEVEKHPKAEPWISNAVTIGGASAVLSPIIQWGHAVAYSSNAVSLWTTTHLSPPCHFPFMRPGPWCIRHHATLVETRTAEHGGAIPACFRTHFMAIAACSCHGRPCRDKGLLRLYQTEDYHLMKPL